MSVTAAKRVDFSSSEGEFCVVIDGVFYKDFEVDYIESFNAIGKQVRKIEKSLRELKKIKKAYLRGEPVNPTERIRDELLVQIEKCEKTFSTFREVVQEEALYYVKNDRNTLEDLGASVDLLRPALKQLNKGFSSKRHVKLSAAKDGANDENCDWRSAGMWASAITMGAVIIAMFAVSSSYPKT